MASVVTVSVKATATRDEPIWSSLACFVLRGNDDSSCCSAREAIAGLGSWKFAATRAATFADKCERQS